MLEWVVKRQSQTTSLQRGLSQATLWLDYFFLFSFYWRIVTLWCINFYYKTKWISHVHVKSLSPVWLWDPADCSPPGSSVHGILWARILEWFAMPSSRGSSRPRDQAPAFCSSCTEGGFFTTSATWEITRLHTSPLFWTSFPFRSPQRISRVPGAIQQVSMSYLFYTQYHPAVGLEVILPGATLGKPLCVRSCMRQAE